MGTDFVTVFVIIGRDWRQVMPAALSAVLTQWCALTVVYQHDNCTVNDLFMILMVAIQRAGSAEFFPLVYSVRVSLSELWVEAQ